MIFTNALLYWMVTNHARKYARMLKKNLLSRFKNQTHISSYMDYISERKLL